jgi:cytochrome c-type biogenesis protein CcmH
MRQIIRQQVAAGQSDAQIEQWFVDRYGQSILLTPPQRGFGLLAWWVPVLLGMLGVSVVVLALVRFTRARPPEEVLPVLSDAEVQHYQAALDEALAARDDESADGVDASPVQPAPPPGIALRPEAPR